MYDILILNGKIVGPRDSAMRDLAIVDDKIVEIGDPGTLGHEAKEVVDASGCLVIPGGIDPHTHFGMEFDPIVCEGPEYSSAAAWGGTTSVVDFAFHEPPQTVHDSIQSKRDTFDGQMAVDYGLHVILTKDFSFESVEELGDVIRAGMPTIKTMMTYGYISDDGQRFGAMQEIANNGGMSVVHAEDDALANWLTKKYIREGKIHGAYICETRGPIVEEAAVRRAMFLAEKAGSPLYVLHMAAGSAVAALSEGASKGLPFYGETLSAYLSFTQEEMWDDTPVMGDGKTYIGRGMLYNNYPTLKFPADREACWQAIADGRLSTVGTDHSSTSIANRFEKMGATLDTFVQAGQSAVELRVPLLYHQGVVGGRISENRWVEIMSTNPAKLMGMWPQKGELTVGSDADVVIFDPEYKWTVDYKELHMSADFNIWDGWEIQGGVRDTLLRGSFLVSGREWVGSKTGGQFVERKMLPELIQSTPDRGMLHMAKRL